MGSTCVRCTVTVALVLIRLSRSVPSPVYSFVYVSIFDVVGHIPY